MSDPRVTPANLWSSWINSVIQVTVEQERR
jgi:hypothetical protein